MEKVHVHCMIPKDYVAEFKDLSGRLEGPCTKGAFGKHLAKAMKEYVSSHYKQQQIAKNVQFADPKRKDIMKTRQLMQAISKASWWNGVEIIRGTRIAEKHLMDIIIKIKNLGNNPRDRRTPKKWIRKLIEYEFIRKFNFNMYEVLETGEDWGGVETEAETSDIKDLKVK